MKNNQPIGRTPWAPAEGPMPGRRRGCRAPGCRPGRGRKNTHPGGRPRWAIAEGYIPGWSHGPEPEMTSHETVCLLNASDRDAHVEITIFFADREPCGPYRVTVPARRQLGR